jgi:hypothetical protein
LGAFLIFFLFHGIARTFIQSVSVVFWHRAVLMSFLAPIAHFSPDAKTPAPYFRYSSTNKNVAGGGIMGSVPPLTQAIC